MSDLLAIFGPTDSDSDLVTEIERLHPNRVTVLIDGVDTDWAYEDSATADALRDRLAALMALIERRTGAVVVGSPATVNSCSAGGLTASSPAATP